MLCIVQPSVSFLFAFCGFLPCASDITQLSAPAFHTVQLPPAVAERLRVYQSGVVPQDGEEASSSGRGDEESAADGGDASFLTSCYAFKHTLFMLLSFINIQRTFAWLQVL